MEKTGDKPNKLNEWTKRFNGTDTLYGYDLYASQTPNTANNPHFVISSSASSPEVTPSSTPQSSPYTVRKTSKGNLTNESNTKSLNPKRWFSLGIFPTIQQTNDNNKSNNNNNNSVFNNNSKSNFAKLKNFSVTNFDINAVGPTSW